MKKFFGLFLLLLLIFGCGDSLSYKKVNLSSNFLKSSFFPSKSLKVAISSMTSPKETLINYESFIKYLERKLNLSIYLYQRQNYSDVNDLLRFKIVDLAFICTYAYVKGEKEFGLKLLAVPESKGEPYYYSYIIVHKESQIKNFSELKGKTFAFTDPLSNTGRLYPLYLLFLEKEDPSKFFSRFIFTYSHDSSIKAVAEKIVDGAAVDSLIYDFNKLKKDKYIQDVKIILKSPAFPSPPVVAAPHLSLEMRLKIREILLNMYKDQEGRKILKDLNLDKFMPIEDKEYDFIRKMAKKVDSR